MSELILQSLYSGALVGGVYALIALGLSLAFGTMRIINLAHGELVLLAAYVAYTVESRFGVNPLLALPFALLVVCICAAVVYFLVSRLKRNRELNSLMLTFALGMILTNGVLMIWSSDIRSTGNAKRAFYQKHVGAGMPTEIKRFSVSGEAEPFPVIEVMIT